MSGYDQGCYGTVDEHRDGVLGYWVRYKRAIGMNYYLYPSEQTLQSCNRSSTLFISEQLERFELRTISPMLLRSTRDRASTSKKFRVSDQQLDTTPMQQHTDACPVFSSLISQHDIV
jgi:hypothetical protein